MTPLNDATSRDNADKRRTLNLLVVLVLCLSAYIQFTMASRSEFSNSFVGDAARYMSYAYNVQRAGIYSDQATLWDPGFDEGKIAPDKIRAPGYPAFLMAVSEAEPTQEWARHIFLWQAPLGVLTVLFTWLLASEVLPGAWALAAAVLTAICPHLATVTAEVMSESLFTAILVAATWALVRGFRLRSLRWSLAAGVLWGLAALTRPTAEFFPPLLAAAILVMPRLRPWKSLAIPMLCAYLLALAPWWVRNQVTELRPAQVDLAVSFLHHGSYPDFKYQGREDTLGMPYRYDPKSAVANASIHGAIENIADNFRSDPLRYAGWYLIGKPISFLSWNIVGGWGDIFTVRPERSPFFEVRSFDLMRIAMRALHAPLMLLAVLATLLALFRPRWSALPQTGQVAAAVIAAVVAYAILLHMVGAPYPRYSIPFRPLLYVLALLPVAALAGRLRALRPS